MRGWSDWRQGGSAPGGSLWANRAESTQNERARWIDYALAVAFTALAVVVRWAVPGVLADTPYLAFYPAVVAAAGLLGMGPGLLATVLSALCVDLLFDITPSYIDFSDSVSLGRGAIFLAGGIGVSIVAGMRKSAQVAQRKQADELVRNERRFRSFVEATTQVTWTTNPRGEVDMAIPAWQAYTGQTEEQARGFGWMDAIRAEDRPRVAEAWQKAFDTGGLYEVEYLVRIHDGSWRNVLARGVPVRDSDGTVRQYVGVCIDTTERKRAEDALRDSEAFYRQTLESIPGMVFTTRPDGYCDYQSQQWVDYTGVPMSEHVGDGWNGLLHPDDRPRAFAAWRAAVEERAPYDLEYRVRRHDGEYEWFKVIGRPIRNTAGQIIRWFGTAINIEDLKRTEGDLNTARKSAERAKAAAEQANRAKDHFLAVLSHELRTPLTPVVMGVSMLQERPDLDAGVRESLEMIRRNAEMEARLIDDLLDVTRIERGKIELNKQHVPICTVIERAVDVCRPDIEARQLQFAVDTGPAAPYWVEADVGRLQQVFWNLLENAIKFTPHGGCVGVRCRPIDKYVVAEVSDSGIGMETDALSRVFNAFEQAERSITRQFGGLGLGLAISKALVEMHGGTIDAHSEGRDKGSTFRVRLPLTVPAGQAEAAAPAPPRAVRSLRILLVEDHGVTAQMINMVLAAEGHTVAMAADVATALELASQQHFDLLMSDLGLPDGSGHDLMRQLRGRGQHFPAIALSGYGQQEDIRRSHEAGFAIHLTKPASPEALANAIESVMNGRPTTPRDDLAPVPKRDLPVFDIQAALKQCLGKRELLAEMIKLFVDDVDTLLPQIRSLLQRGDFTNVGRLGHRLKGTIVHLAAEPAREAAMRVERIAECCRDRAEAEEAVRMLEHECHILRAALAEYQAQAPPVPYNSTEPMERQP